jgi:hypothetical protein
MHLLALIRSHKLEGLRRVTNWVNRCISRWCSAGRCALSYADGGKSPSLDTMTVQPVRRVSAEMPTVKWVASSDFAGKLRFGSLDLKRFGTYRRWSRRPLTTRL